MLWQAALFGIVYFIVYKAQYMLNSSVEIRFDTMDVTIFFATSSCIIWLHFLFLEKFPKIKPQLGFIYLPTLFIKGILFYIFFKDSVFIIENLTTPEQLNLIVPLVVFLILEVYLISGILNMKSTKI